MKPYPYPMYKPVPVDKEVAEFIRKKYDLDTIEEACQPRIIRDFFEQSLTDVESAPVDKQDLTIEYNKVQVDVSILRPVGSKHKELPVILYMHGGGWVFGSYNSTRMLTNELVNLLPCCIVFVNYSYSPEVQYPVALEQCYATLCWVQENSASLRVDPKRLAVAGDSAGGNLSTTLSMLAKQRGNTCISYQLLFYPVINTDFETESYQQNKDNTYLPRSSMEYFWEAYVSKEQHGIPTVTPIYASLDMLRDLPPALVITTENDVLRSEGEAYAKKLKEAGVPTISVRYLGTIHGFMTPIPRLTPDANAAIAQTVDILKRHWKLDEDVKSFTQHEKFKTAKVVLFVFAMVALVHFLGYPIFF